MEQRDEDRLDLTQESAATVLCPLCAEMIQKDAMKCKHCGSFLRPRKDVLAVISFISAFVPLLCVCMGVVPFICSIVSLVRIHNYKGILSGKRLAIAALVVGTLTSMLNISAIVGMIISERENRRRLPAPFQADGEMEIGGYWQEAEDLRRELADIVNQAEAAYKSYKRDPSNPKRLYAKIDKLNLRLNELRDSLPGATEEEFDSANEKLKGMIRDVGDLLEQFDAKRITKERGKLDDEKIQAAIMSFNRNMAEFFKERDEEI